MDDPIRFLTRAADYAARAHRQQRRKDPDRTPYINHLCDVARLLAEAGCHVELIAAGYLHDTIEDVGVTYEMLVEEFGVRVAELVRAVTDDKSLDKARRKQLQIEHAASASSDVAALKLADKISNLTSLRDQAPDGWPETRVLEYIEWAHRVVTRLPNPDPHLLARYKAIREDLFFQRGSQSIAIPSRG